MPGEQRRDGRRHLITAATTTPVVEAAAAALASSSDEPMPARSAAAAETGSGVAITNDMGHLPPRHNRSVRVTRNACPATVTRKR